MSTMTMLPTTLETGAFGGQVGGAFGTDSTQANPALAAAALPVMQFESLIAQWRGSVAPRVDAATSKGVGGLSGAAPSSGEWPGSAGTATSVQPLDSTSALSSLPAVLQAIMAGMRGSNASPAAGNAPIPPTPAASTGQRPAAQSSADVEQIAAPASGASNTAPRPDTTGGGASANSVGASATVALPPNSISALSLGVKNDGSTDDTASLNAAIKTANSENKALYLPAGTYEHSGEVIDDGGKMDGAGSATDLKATKQDQSAVELTGNGGSLSQMTVTAPYSNRSSQPGAAAVLLQDANNASVSNVTAIGGASNSIRFADTQNSIATNDLTEDSAADGVAITANSSNNEITKSQLVDAGDDEASDDDYANQAGRDANNKVDGNLIGGNHFGGGVALEGGVGDKASNNVIKNTPGSSIRAGTDANSGTKTGSGDTFANNTSIGSGAAPFAVNGMSENNDVVATDDAVAIAKLGFTPVADGALTPPSAVDGGYQVGTGVGSNNTSGNRT